MGVTSLGLSEAGRVQFQLHSVLSLPLFSSINLSFCLNASGKHVPNSIGEEDRLWGGLEGLSPAGRSDRLTQCFPATGFEVELQLDWQKQKGGIRRALFLASKQATLTQTLLIQNGAREDCREMKIYLRVWAEGAVGLAWAEGHIE